MTTEARYSSSDLARIVGCSRKAVRVYEAKQLLGPKTGQRSKRYGAAAVDRLRLIVTLRQMDMPIERIAKFLSLRSNGHNDAGAAARRVTDAIGEAIVDVNARIAELTHLRDELDQIKQGMTPCTGCPKPQEACQECADTGKLAPAARALLIG